MLIDVGGFARSDVFTLVDGDATAVRDLLDDLEFRIKASKARGHDVVVVVYYSGHASNGHLHLGDKRIEMRELRDRLTSSAADVRLAFLDSCGAGAITRGKGAVLAAPFVVKVEQQLASTGQVIIASSSADEVSQESDDIQGSFFTHYLTTGLRGDADTDHDGTVTLDEAYRYAYGRTVAATSATRAGAQHPTYAFDLQGAGDVVLTRPGGADVVVEFPGDLEGRYFVVDLDRQLFVAEVDKQKGGVSQIAVPRGQYAIKKRLDSHLLMTRVQAREKGSIVIDDTPMQAVAFADDYAKGTPLGINQFERPVSLSFGVGVGYFGVVDPSGFDDGNLFPAMTGLQGHLRFHHLLRSQLTLDLDLSVAATRAIRTVEGGSLGDGKFDVEATLLQSGVAVVWEQPLVDIVGVDIDVAVGPRLAGLLFRAPLRRRQRALHIVDAISGLPPSLREPGRRVWGPHFDDVQGTSFRFEMLRTDNGFEFCLHSARGRLIATDASNALTCSATDVDTVDDEVDIERRELVQLLTGSFVPSGIVGDAARQGSGTMHLEAGRMARFGREARFARGVDFVFDNADGGTVIDIDLAGTPVDGVERDAAYHFDRSVDGDGALVFEFFGEFVAPQPPLFPPQSLERMVLSAAWNADRAGRASAVVDGDNADGTFTVEQCWNAPSTSCTTTSLATNPATRPPAPSPATPKTPDDPVSERDALHAGIMTVCPRFSQAMDDPTALPVLCPAPGTRTPLRHLADCLSAGNALCGVVSCFFAAAGKPHVSLLLLLVGWGKHVFVDVKRLRLT